MLEGFVVVLSALAAGLAGALLYGAHRWKVGTQTLRARLDAVRSPVRPQVIDFAELEGLPAPVQRYFRAVLEEGKPMVAGVRLQHRGVFNIGESADRWKPFTSDQRVVTRRPGFDWEARIFMLPGVPVRVHDAYAAGEGILYASLFGLFPLVSLRGTEDLAEGELMRFFAEAAWYPTALLPSQGVRWDGVDERSARGTLTEGGRAVTMLFTFNEQGLIDTVLAEARGRLFRGKILPTPWQGRFWNYEARDHMRVPLDGEVAWLMPEGPKPYWRGRITELVYELARPQ
jgi:hypothetical protein